MRRMWATFGSSRPSFAVPFTTFFAGRPAPADPDDTRFPMAVAKVKTKNLPVVRLEQNDNGKEVTDQ